MASGVGAVAGSAPIIFVVNPAQAAPLNLWQGGFAYGFLVSSAVAAKTVVALAPNGWPIAIDTLPRFSISREAVVLHGKRTHTRFSSQLALPAGASILSLYQTIIGLKLFSRAPGRCVLRARWRGSKT